MRGNETILNSPSCNNSLHYNAPLGGNSRMFKFSNSCNNTWLRGDLIKY